MSSAVRIVVIFTLMQKVRGNFLVWKFQLNISFEFCPRQYENIVIILIRPVAVVSKLKFINLQSYTLFVYFSVFVQSHLGQCFMLRH